MEDLVSIIMPSYNTGGYIYMSIESVLKQTYKNWELLIVDDGSNDNTDEVVMSFHDKRIKYYKNSRSKGAAYSRNRALKKAKGSWIAFLDSDDLWYEKKLEHQICYMKKNGYVFSYTEYVEIDEKSNWLGTKVTGPHKITKSGMHCYCWPGCLTVMYNRNAVGDIQIKNIKKNNDYAMWLKVCEKADCYLLREVLGKYRKRQGSISNHRYSSLIKWHYLLFHEVQEEKAIIAWLYMVCNLFFGLYKKLFYVRRKVHIRR